MKLFALWNRLRSSFWFVPTLMALGAALLSSALLLVDRSVEAEKLLALKFVYTGTPQGATALLSTIAGSMITIAGVVFSMTLVALSMASGQFGPRLLHNFMRDAPNQVVLGTFVATFLFCLLILRAIRFGEEEPFVPFVSISVAVGLALASLAVLIYFIHHVAISIQADHLVERVGRELVERVSQLEDGSAQPDSSEPLPEAFSRSMSITAVADGYVQLIDTERLVEIAEERGLVAEVVSRSGDFVVAGAVLVRVARCDIADEEIASKVREAFVFGKRRTSIQDIRFAIDLLVEVAARALSPGINDPFTAMACLDRLGAGLAVLTRKNLPRTRLFSKDGTLRVIVPTVCFSEYLDSAFAQIRHYGRADVGVVLRMLSTIGAVGEASLMNERRQDLARQAAMVMRAARESIREPHDLERIEEEFKLVGRALGSAI